MSLYIFIARSLVAVSLALISLRSPTLLHSLLPLSCSCRKFADFVERTRKNAKYAGMLESIDEEH